MKRPGSVTIAVVLTWISAILVLLAGIGIFVSSFAVHDQQVREDLERALGNAGMDPNLSATLPWALMAGGMVIIAIAVLEIFVAVYLAKGRSWARTLVTVFVVLSMLGHLPQLFAGGSQLISALFGLAIEAVILFLLWNARASAFFAQRTAQLGTAAAA